MGGSEVIAMMIWKVKKKTKEEAEWFPVLSLKFTFISTSRPYYDNTIIALCIKLFPVNIANQRGK